MMETPRDPAASRYEHAASGLRRSDLDRDPIKQFGNWFTAAIEASIRDVNAISLATAGADGRPSVRIVLLKGFDHDGFVFFTNYRDSAKRNTAEKAANRHWRWLPGFELNNNSITGKRRKPLAKNRKPIRPSKSAVS